MHKNHCKQSAERLKELKCWNVHRTAEFSDVSWTHRVEPVARSTITEPQTRRTQKICFMFCLMTSSVQEEPFHWSVYRQRQSFELDARRQQEEDEQMWLFIGRKRWTAELHVQKYTHRNTHTEIHTHTHTHTHTSCGSSMIVLINTVVWIFMLFGKILHIKAF